MTIPIIFIHYGNSNCLFQSIWQAKQSNPDSPIILLGDQANIHYHWLLGIDHYLIKAYTDNSRYSLKHYVHLSTNGELFERFCIERWFILYRFLQQRPDIPRCVYLDSDVLIYDLLDPPADELAHFGMTMVGYSAHTNFVSNKNVLGEFCLFIQQHYNEPSKKSWLHDHYSKFIEKHGCGGISDMTFFHKFRAYHSDEIGIISDVFGKDLMYTFDERIDTDFGGYEMQNGFKNIFWLNGKPYCKNNLNRKIVKFNTLHFQGASKIKMIDFVQNRNILFWVNLIINQTVLLQNKIFRKFKLG
ncbi:hypothetical protein MC7420_7469 [Coleofasciculus chthonoplastes PCC 7420]|uniref:Nucleotide-diphospho-sugar transferase domain-containing protein n=1 Tax=Coleofasciculus chthonoplastes PCC 7420 TaxID=118168 RepID=B4VH98_9CYAN|nr:hypothetical protein [Coleofasciculus chthonoplastes]EDX78816.1 hypothetical protein MC7420_7469 [Coleofasciculus chthonoplastes PCC 7420]